MNVDILFITIGISGIAITAGVGIHLFLEQLEGTFFCAWCENFNCIQAWDYCKQLSQAQQSN